MIDGILSRLNRVFRDFFDDDELTLTPGMTAAEVEGWDSVATVELMIAVEREFGIRLRTGDIASLENVGQLCERIRGRMT